MSSEVQIAVIDQQDTQIVLAVPGVQGATGSELAAGGTANQVLRKASSTDYDTDWSLVTSAMIENGAIVDADVNASAAIAGTKISPNFGSQNVVTTGTSTAASFIPSSSSVPTNGLYLPSANNVALATNGTGKLFINATGEVLLGDATDTDTYIHHPAADTIGIITGGNGVYFKSGSLGVGTSSPSTKLDLASNFSYGTASSNVIRLGASFSGGTATSPSSLGAITWGSNDTASEHGRINVPVINPSTSNNSSMEFWINSSGMSQAMTLMPTGLGIGTTTVDEKLVCAGAGMYTGAASSTARDGAIIDFSSNISRFIAGRAGGNYGSMELHVAGASGVTKRQRIEYDGNTIWYGANGTSEAMRLDSSSRLLLGTSSASGNNTLFESSSTSANSANVALVKRNSGTADQAGQQLHFYNFGPFGTARAADTEVGNIRFYGSQPTSGAAQEMASIQCAADLLQTGANTSGRLVFSVTADSSASPTEALRISSNRSITVSDGGNVVLGTTTGTKIGTATSQKIGFYNATPVVQPTTGVAEAAFVENSGGTAVNVDSTFGGYTIQQVVEALQTLGLLA